MEAAGGTALLLEGSELRIIEAADSAQKLLGCRRRELLGQAFTSLLNMDQAALVPGVVTRLLQEETSQLVLRAKLRRRDRRTVRISVSLTRIASARPLLLAVVREPARSNTRRAHPAALSDALTGLACRTVLDARLAAAHEGVRQGVLPLAAVLFIDLDGFKQVNDLHGHLAGDDVLRVVAQRLMASVRPDDVVARYGGDEFVVLLENVASREEVRGIARRICRRLKSPIQSGRRRLSISASVGAKIVTRRDKTPRALIAAADEAMYQAKGLAAHLVVNG